jgi:flagellar biosynthesis/type III secretory pathway protein FliH
MPTEFRLQLPKPPRRVTIADAVAQPLEPKPNSPAAVPARTDGDRQFVEQLVGRVIAAVGDVRRERRQADEQRLSEWRRVAVELGLTIATKLLHEKITAGEFALEALVRDMAAQFNGPPPITVRLHPDDLAVLRQRLGGSPLLADAESVLVADPALGRGNCRIEAGGQMLLSDLADQLEDLRTTLLRSLGHAGS